ncbi:hypothetical protein [Paenibacillus glycanilyticus]|uniref:DUF3953 domain-containing protein n=1 Tax=Paenibacillus glycanilyticus TaxID=126569 RepID=A0ABQ6GER2_9BACL|nr:hypothetical protein [Paenibacillus glycanilyticus]GLX68723.1 hypothetical protein MU1_30680 [Paenibacillus glycanilyticus]
MRNKKANGPLIKGLNPEKTKKLIFIAVVLLVVGMLTLSYCYENGILTNNQAITSGCIVMGISFILLMIDTFARDRTTAFYRLFGSALFLVFLIVRYYIF